MPRLASRAVPARALTHQPALAGFRPAAAALAVATAFTLPVTLRAQPVGGQAVAGQASFVRNGANLLVTTQNAAGTNHSAINWQSFSVPVGSITQFNQPSAASTSINRVLGSDPSAIFGTLSSNGRLVLVNPAGIAVGQGAVVDTAGFTASTLPMGEADAIAGRLRFAGNGGALQVDGSIVARSGDVVLIAPNVQTGADAVVQANGATVLAAGQKVEITGRGLEGIRLEVQAPENQAVNLGTLKGDAVGIFAGTLKHSGLVQAQAVTSEGGKVLLKALGDNLVSGAVQGRSIDVLGDRVGLLAGAAIDASGAQGGGQVRIGGDYQGKNPDVQNAKRTYVDAQASIKADATQQGDGGRVIVWSDEATRMHGQISARGGAQGGDGGFVEVSGKQFLAFTGRADTRAPQGKMGTLLLDPEDVDIVSGAQTAPGVPGGEFTFNTDAGPSTIKDGDLNAQLTVSDVLVTTSNTFSSGAGGMIRLNTGAKVDWNTDTWLSLRADKGIQLDGSIYGTGSGSGLSMQALSGGIVGANQIQVANLYANAIVGTSTDPNAGKVLLTGDNLVGRVAGVADKAFTFNNINPLAIGWVSSPHGGSGGISVSGGPVAVKAAGNLTVESESAVNGNSVSLTSTGGSVSFGSASGVSSNGRLDIQAATSVTSSGSVYLEAGGGATGGLHINAGSGDVDFSSGSFNLYSYQSPIEITAGGSILTNAISYSTYGTVNGWVQLTATSGGISYGNINANGSSGSFSVNAGGKVSLLAKGDISGGGIGATGGYRFNIAGGGAPGGDVSVESTDGSVRIGSVATQGGNASTSSLGVGMGGAGGAISLKAAGAGLGGVISAGVLSSYGGTGTGAKGGDAGDVSALADGGISLGDVNAYGGSVNYSSLGVGAGGAGGDITLKSMAAAGDTVVAGYLSAYGGFGSGGSGGAGGAVVVKADGSIQLLNVDASGAEGSTSTAVPVATGGAGGTIEITSDNGNITLGQKSGSSISVYGGAMVGGGYGGSLAGGGAGGGIVLSAPVGTIDITGDLGARGGNSDNGLGGDARYATQAIAVNAGQNVNISGLDASGGESSFGSGGHGGAVTVQSTGASVSLGSLRARGGNASFGSASGGTGGSLLLSAKADLGVSSDIDVSGGQGQTGGNGGGATLQATNIAVSGVYARGGEDYYSSTTGPGKGGNGGDIVVDLSGTLSAWTFDASGGHGRNGTSGALNGTPGGDGGTVQLTQTSGDLQMNGVSLLAAGGMGGDAYIDGGPGLAGAGGKGGFVSATASVGSAIVSGGTLSATAGMGGTNADDVTRAPYGSVPGAVVVRAAGDLDLSGGDLWSLDHASFLAQAGGNIASWQLISTSGTPVTLSAGDAAASATPNPAAALGVYAPISTIDPDTSVGGALALTASGSVAVDVQPPPSFAFASSIAPIIAGPVTITAPQVTIVAGNQVIGMNGVNVKADSIDVSGSINAVAGILSIDAISAGRTIRLGGTDETGSLNLTQPELDQVSAGTVIIGNTANTGSLVVESSVSFNRDAVGSLRLLTGADLQLAGTITANPVTAPPGPVPTDAVVLAANSINVGPGVGIDVSDGRWLTYIAGPLASSNFGTLASGQRALWNRTYAKSPPGTVAEPGNRYLFAFQPTITIDATSQSKVYDGTAIGSGAFTATPVIDASAYGNVWLQDPDPVISVKVASPSKNVGSYAIVQDTVTVPDGYAFVFNGGVATITPRTLALTVAAQNKVYDATTAAQASASPDNRVAGDDLNVTLASASFNDKNVGAAKPVTIAGLALTGADAGNYSLANTTATTTADITPRALAVVATAQNKVYDATTKAAVVTSDDHIAGDALTVNVGPSNFSDKNAGAAKPVTLGAISLGGADAGNYMLASPPTTSSADISQRSLVIALSAQNKVYDATTAATASVSDDHLAGDSLAVTVGSANFSDKNVGTGKTVTAAGLALSGADAGNYALPGTSATTTADITKRPLSVAVSAQNKEYDATTAATVTASDNRIAGDSLTVAVGSASFADKNVGSGKSVSFGSVTLTGADAGNYSLAGTPASGSANITPAPVTVAADNLSKPQGTELLFAGTEFSASGLKGGESITSVSLASAGAPASAPIGAYVITPSAAVGGNGFLAGNYTVSYLDGALAVFSPSQLPEIISPVTTFTQLFLEMAKAQEPEKKIGKDDIVLTDTQCKP